MNKAIIAKAAIALSNHEGGYLMLGFKEQAQILESKPRPRDIPEITQDDANGIIRRYAEPEFHCECQGRSENVPERRSDGKGMFLVVEKQRDGLDLRGQLVARISETPSRV